MTNKELIKYLEYNERVMRELHGIKVAMPFKVALEAARAAVESTKYDKGVDNSEWRATGAAPVAEEGRDGFMK